MTVLVVVTTLDQETPVRITGDQHLVTGAFTYDTGDYVTGGNAITAAQLRLDSIDRVLVGGSSIVGTRSLFLKSTSKVKTFKEDATSGIEAEHGASALTAQTIPFIAFGRKAS